MNDNRNIVYGLQLAGMALLFTACGPDEATVAKIRSEVIAAQQQAALEADLRTKEKIRVENNEKLLALKFPSDTETEKYANGAYYAPLSAYQLTLLEDWHLMVSKELLQSPLWPAVQKETSQQLILIKKRLPAKMVSAMQKVTIFFELNRGMDPCAVYHPNKDWLGENGYNPAKANCVEVTHVQNFIDWTRYHQPFMLMHELAHSYHDQVLGFDNSEIAKLFAQAQKQGSYDAVLRLSTDQRVKAYAMSNAQEYFAEAIESYFGVNDFYPFVSRELKESDPDMYNWIHKNLDLH